MLGNLLQSLMRQVVIIKAPVFLRSCKIFLKKVPYIYISVLEDDFTGFSFKNVSCSFNFQLMGRKELYSSIEPNHYDSILDFSFFCSSLL